MGPKPGNMSQNGQKTAFDVTHQKPETQNQKIVFSIFSLITLCK